MRLTRCIWGTSKVVTFETKEVGSFDAMKGKLDGVSVEIHCLKESEYVMMLVSSYGTLEKVGDEKSRIWSEDNKITKETAIKYPESVYNHFQYCDAVDAHNSSRMFPVALEETWKTQRWPCRVLSFLLAIIEVNHTRISVWGCPAVTINTNHYK